MAVPSPEGKGLAPYPGAVDAVGTEPTAITGDGVSASSREIRDDLIDTVRSLLDGLTFADQCAVIGIHPQKATRRVGTVAGVGGRIVEIGAQPSQAVGVSYELLRETISADERYARALQAEEQVEAARIAETIETDEKVAWSLSQGSCSPALQTVSPLSRRRNPVPPSPFGSPAHPEILRNNMSAPVVSPGPHDMGRKTRDAARALRAKADASAAFSRAHAGDLTATRGHDQYVTDFRGGRDQEVVLEREKRELLESRRAAMRLEEVEVAKLRATRLAKE